MVEEGEAFVVEGGGEGGEGFEILP